MAMMQRESPARASMPRGYNSALYERGLCSYARFATYESLSANGEEQGGERSRGRERAISAHEIWKRSTVDLDARSSADVRSVTGIRSREIAVIRGRVAALCGHDHCWITRHNGETRRDWR
ncbi:Uncharacterized protein DBV15_11560 [Temnothorax longispinosus]|uniref:Uncharacterized protein n=1 Tax=Temnothorax longispinosus TaxID=300112 RepID=A0A4S2KST9_9HYME|nr:Uncharacterized protein DBV15_11560 [Temnothorax longispinosus]